MTVVEDSVQVRPVVPGPLWVPLDVVVLNCHSSIMQAKRSVYPVHIYQNPQTSYLLR